ncbi:uroporphyrinogen-III C-methyltransferase [Rubinisphaera sp.]|uniref:uroporphyrinogen-III C-methyltransferase n=1 Tax=Rubinisphaera sp. TaxID=2024857 RepID=UPI000C104D63|nr:uroporphyrinogen-III C-methyltransferase [Rubinisphaera sp.]MBV11764.1 uroporphyrinogen-III C-methyltransferase [Rubinisphaera sp.]HCS53313.1 uroporphyrinogen-III C-methyltransferase [Planctomycetaceae bacterium]
MPSQTGKVYLVGGGPGDPGLISLKGLECLRKADFILYDGLVNPLLLRHTSAQAERTARADSSGKRTLQQEQINQRLIAEAKLGKTVVRLKGGDPYIFGRGSEEAEALAAENIEFEVVPGITAATAAAEYAGFSLTHRDYASAVCLITGHEDPAKPSTALDYNLLAKFPGTLVFYMGLHRLPEIAEALISEGMSASIPAAIITKASTPFQRVVTDELANLPDRVSKEDLSPPSLIIVGECVQMRERIHWFENKPLIGKRIGITRPSGQAEPQIQMAVSLGADPVLMPLIEITKPESNAELDQKIRSLDQYEWLLFTSANGVQHFFDRVWEIGSDSRLLNRIKIACIGSSTAEALETYRLRADLVPDDYCSESLAEALIQRKPEKPVLWMRANRGRDIISTQLKSAGIHLDEAVAYHHQDAVALSEQSQHLIETGQLDWIGLSSPAIARQLAKLIPEQARQYLGNKIKLAAISPITAQAAEETGLPITAIATEFTWDGIFDAIQKASK